MKTKTEILAEQLVTTEELAETLGVSRRRIWDLAQDRRIVGIKIGRQWRFRLSDVSDLIDNGTETGRKGDKK